MIATVKDFKLNRIGSQIEGIPVSVYELSTDKLIGHFITITKAFQTLTGFSRNGNGSRILDKLDKKGRPKSFKIRSGGRAYMKTAVDVKILKPS